MKWEYQVESLIFGQTSKWTRALNELGRDDWELVTVTPAGPGEQWCTAILKRPLTSK